MSFTKHDRTEGNDVWLTPPQLLSVLGQFDLDPCAAPSPRPWSTAVQHIELPENGLERPWFGRVWLNPPYSEAGPWLKKMATHASGIALIFARLTNRVWRSLIWRSAKAILFIDGRLTFYFPDGSRAPFDAGAPSALVAYSEYDAEVLTHCGVKGVLIKSWEQR